MISLQILGVGVIGPGLDGWAVTAPLLCADSSYSYSQTQIPAPGLLPANERRRTTPCIKLALAVAEQAVHASGLDAMELASVFSSSHGDMRVSDNICRALATEERLVSPTQFHNSVHNAPAGYWSIATGYRQASTSIASLQGTFAAGLLEAALQADLEGKPVLLVCYDLPAPAPLDQLIANATHFASALLISPACETGDRLATLGLKTAAETTQTPLQDPQLEGFRTALPAARALPLLQALARREASHLQLPYIKDLGLCVEITP
jgi:hypothetical protein